MLNLTEAPRKRRSQAERSAETRERVIEAAIACIAEDGFKQATTSRIARRAGVTWGAIQHQFGDKESILRAVMERGMEEFRDTFADAGRQPETLEERVSEFTQRGWMYFQRPAFRAFLDVFLNLRGDEEANQFKHECMRYMAELWEKVFGNLGVDPQSQITAQRFAMAVLIGMAIEIKMLPELNDFSGELEALDSALLKLQKPASPH